MAEERPVERKKRGRWKRRLAWTSAGAGALLLGALATLDWWLPALATRAAGAEFSEREVDYGRSVEWRDLSWSDAELGVAFRAGRARIDAPTRILRNGLSTEARIDDWTLTIAPAPVAGKDDDEKPFGWPELIDTLRLVGDQLDGRLRGATLENGRVLVAGEEIEISRLEIAPRKFGGTMAWSGEQFSVEIDLVGNHVWLAHHGSRADLKLSRLERDRFEGGIEWQNNTATIAAAFADGEWLPRTFNLTGKDWRVPAERAGLEDYYAELVGGFSARREGENLLIEIAADAEPREAGAPALKIAAELLGRTDYARVQKLEITAPGLAATLSSPVDWRAGRGLGGVGEPVFSWRAELATLLPDEAKGVLGGSARLRPNGRDWSVAWEATGEGLGWRELAGYDATLRGESTRAVTRVAEAELRGPDELEIAARGAWLHAERRVAGGRFSVETSGKALARWLPEGLSLGRVAAQGTVEGAPAAPRVDGSVSAETVAWAGWVATRVGATVGYAGADDFRIDAQAEHGGARLEAKLARAGERVTAETFTLRNADGGGLALARPLVATLDESGRSLTAEWTGAGETVARINWEERGASSVFIQNMDTSWLDDWREARALPDLAIRRARIDGRVADGGWITGGGEVDMAWRRAGRPDLWARAAGELADDGMRLAELSLGEAGESLAVGGGVAPWRARVSAEGRVLEPVAGGEWSLHLRSSPEATLWEELAKWAGVELRGPGLALALSGPAREPSGRIELSAARIGLEGEGLPEGGLVLEGLDAAARVTRGELQVDRLTARVDGQRIEADGRLDLGDGGWERMQRRPFLWIRDHADARVSLPEARVAALARYMPMLLAPQGTVSAELRLTPGANLDGSIRLREATTRPIGSFGVLQDIEADLRLAGKDVRIEKLAASAGGQAVEITGGARRVPGRMPLLDLRVKAERFPLVRRPGLLLRGDIDIALKTDAAEDGSAGRTRVSGGVRLRDSLFLADIRPLIAADGGGGGGSAHSRPPYFSVETPPLSEWEIDLRVGGDRFLRIRTPVFEGMASAAFELEGTLREPRATGEFRIDRGMILFPFASFAVQTGAVRLPKADPFTPLLDFRATGRRLDYDLGLEITGTANSPQLQFFSSPPLEMENIVLMVTAGAAPTDADGTATTAQRLAAVGAYVGWDLLRTLGFGDAAQDEDRLSFSSGEKVSRQGRETYGFEYRLNEKWSLTGEYDEFDAYNVGLKRRLRQAPPEEPEKTDAETTKAKEDDDAR